MKGAVTLKVLGSSSTGNGYVLVAPDGVLLIEAGIRFSEVKKAIGWDVGGICGCLVTHRHGDHCAYISEVMRNGIKVMSNEDVLSTVDYRKTPNFGEVLKPFLWHNVGCFRVLAFDVLHDVPCMGFVVEHALMGRLLFLTDTMMCEYTFKGISHAMVEANYSDAVLNANIKAGIEPQSMKARLLKSHMELDTAIGVVKANMSDDLRTVVLIHLSGRNSDKKQFQNEFAKATGMMPFVAEAGAEIQLCKNNPY